MIKYIIALSAALLVAGCADTGSSKDSASPAPADTTKPAAKPSASAAAPARKADKLEGIPLVWKPTSSVGKAGAIDLSGLANTKLQVDPVTDSRSDPGFIGQNSEKQPPRKVTTPDNVAAFVNEHLKQLISSVGITVVESGGTAILKAEIQQFFVEETDTYKGDVHLKVTLTDRKGKAVWTGPVGGGSNRFGRSYKGENYYETLSDSLVDTVDNLLKNPGFIKALAEHS